RALSELARARAIGDDARIAELSSRAHRQLGSYQRAYDEAKAARSDDAELLALLAEDLGIACTLLGRTDEARGHLERALSSTDPRAQMRVQSYLAILEQRLGRPRDAIQRPRATLKIAATQRL